LVNSTIKNNSLNNISHLDNKKKKNNNKMNINIFPINGISNSSNVIHNKIEKLDISSNKDLNLVNYDNLNDQELNSLDYNIAIYVDKRTYFQYYWSLIKKKQLILFTFIPTNDYNLYTLKISLFLLSFSLYLTINGFFFRDSTMSNITENNGKFDIIYQIPQIFYSSLISAIINILLKTLSLSEKNILELKKENNSIKAEKDSKRIKNCITIKFIIFFIISIILLAFFWYFITCFCAVYTNTQIILFKDTIISFSLSMIYPFVLSLFPGMFRIPALKDKDQNSKYLYQISTCIALI
jgi:hypothetical protein